MRIKITWTQETCIDIDKSDYDTSLSDQYIKQMVLRDPDIMSRAFKHENVLDSWTVAEIVDDEEQ